MPVSHWFSVPMQTNDLFRYSDKLISPDCQKFTQIFRSFGWDVESNFTPIDTHAWFFVACVHPEVAEDAEQLLYVHVVYEPHLPHVLSGALILKVLVPGGRKIGVRDVWVKLRSDRWLVEMKPILRNRHWQVLTLDYIAATFAFCVLVLDVRQVWTRLNIHFVYPHACWLLSGNLKP